MKSCKRKNFIPIIEFKRWFEDIREIEEGKIIISKPALVCNVVDAEGNLNNRTIF